MSKPHFIATDPADPSPTLLAALDETGRELAERELREAAEQQRADRVCAQALAAREAAL